MKKILFLVVLLAVAISAKAQIKFQRTYGIGVYNEGRSVKQTFDGGYIVAGTESGAGNGATDVYLLKIDSLGNFMWHKTFGGSNIDRGYAVEQMNDSGYAICGYTNSFGNGGYDGYLIRTDKNGDTLWTKTYGTPDWDFLYAMKKTFDGGFVLAGNSYGNSAAQSEAWILKVASDGTIQWERQFVISSASFLNAIIQTPESDFVAIGYITGGINNSEDILAIKLSSTGDSIWSYSYGDTGNDIGTSIALVNTGGYIIGATLENINTGFGDLYLLKTDTSGIEGWHQEFISSAGDFLSSVHQLGNGGFVICGFTFGAGGGGSDITFILTDSGGTFFSSRTYGTPESDFGYDLNKCNDKGFIIAGKTNGLGPGQESVYLIKTDSTGFTDSTKVISVVEPEDKNDEIICYPNPSKKFLHIFLKTFNASLNEGIEITIYNISGEIMYCQNISSVTLNKDFVLEIENLEAGCYFVSAISKQHNFKKKFFIIH